MAEGSEVVVGIDSGVSEETGFSSETGVSDGVIGSGWLVSGVEIV